MPFEFIKTDIKEVILIKPKVFDRQLVCKKKAVIIGCDIVVVDKLNYAGNLERLKE